MLIVSTSRSEIITYRKIISEDINANISNQAVNDEPVLTTHDKGENDVQQSNINNSCIII